MLRDPVYTDRETASDLAYLSDFTGERVKNARSLSTPTVQRLLAARDACILISETMLTRLRSGLLPVDPQDFRLLRDPPKGWQVVSVFPSAVEPLERLGVLCPERSSP
jgi:hypothetical protein